MARAAFAAMVAIWGTFAAAPVLAQDEGMGEVIVTAMRREASDYSSEIGIFRYCRLDSVGNLGRGTLFA